MVPKKNKKQKQKKGREGHRLRAVRVGGLPYQMHPMLSIPHIPHALLLLPRTAQSFIDRIILTYISLSPIPIYLWPNSAVSISPHILWHRNPISRIHMREVTGLLRPSDYERGLEHQYRRRQFLHLKVREGSAVTEWCQERRAFPYRTVILKLSSVCPRSCFIIHVFLL